MENEEPKHGKHEKQTTKAKKSWRTSDVKASKTHPVFGNHGKQATKLLENMKKTCQSRVVKSRFVY